jgi:succinate dehydrogenase / fumarate reductase flavoprotein subunit
MEFVQFHPTGLYRHGILLSEAARGEGAYILNGEGERLMSRYAPAKMELAPRDVVSRAEQSEINNGRGIDGKDFVYLDLRHLGRDRIMERLPQVYELALNYLKVDGCTQPIPIQPTAHYSMGGIPANIKTEVISDARGTVVPGLYSAGEASCLSLHGANRLGTNSLQDAATFGRLAGNRMVEFLTQATLTPLPKDALDPALAKVQHFMESSGSKSTERHADIRDELQQNMTKKVGVFRVESDMVALRENILELQDRFRKVRIDDHGMAYNLDLIEAFEVGNLLAFSQVIVECAIARKESRGAHFRTDYPDRNDEEWLVHTLAWRDQAGKIRLDLTRRVTIDMDRYPPQERKY